VVTLLREALVPVLIDAAGPMNDPAS
jgi:hypothetical protein